MALLGRTTVCSSVFAALCAMTSGALAQTRSDATVFDHATESTATDESRSAPRTFTINDAFERDVTDGCRYRSSVRGTVRTRPATRGSDDAGKYLADLRITSQLQCGTVTTRGPARTVRGEIASLAELEHAVSDASILRTAVSGYECRYEPRFEFNGTQFQGQAIAQACRYNAPPSEARGGGPRAPRVTSPVQTPTHPVEQNAHRPILVP